MRERQRFRAHAGQSRLLLRTEERHPVLYTEGLDPEGGPVYGERVLARDGRLLRHWEPHRSKLGAALAKQAEPTLPGVGETWLYLGAATGTTVSHVADLVGPRGAVLAVERSVRPFARLLALAERYPNVLPLLADARRPEEYAGDVATADGLYADVAQPDQVEIVLENARLFLGPSRPVVLALKTASLGRGPEPRAYLEAASRALAEGGLEVDSATALEPFHRRHFLVGATATARLFGGGAAGGSASATPGLGRAARRR